MIDYGSIYLCDELKDELKRSGNWRMIKVPRSVLLALRLDLSTSLFGGGKNDNVVHI